MEKTMHLTSNLRAVDYTTLNFNRGATLSYGKRIGFVDENDKSLFKANPRGEIGKLGISYHNAFESLFHSTIKVNVTDNITLAKRTVYLNKKSAVKWLNSQLPNGQKVTNRTKSNEILNKINNLSTVLKQTKKEAEESAQDTYNKTGEPTYSTSFNKRSLHSIVDRIKAFFWKSFTKFTNSSWNRLRLRFALRIKEKTVAEASQILAVSAHQQAKRVPAYNQLLQKQGGRFSTFDQVPVTSKDNYIKPALKSENEKSLYLDGKIPLKVKRDTSTGTSGPSTPWYRGAEEQQHVERMTTYAAKAVLGDRPYSFINGFAMGPWATGVTATLAMTNNAQAGVAVIGPNIDEIYSCIKEQARIYGKQHPIVVSGYPPHIRAVVEKAVEEGFPMHEYTVIGVVGGEAMSEDLRDLLVEQKDGNGKVTRTGLKQCYSSYGASDLDINIGYESDFEIELRKLCHKPENAALAEELFGKNEFKPMIFHYDPLNYHIETDKHRNLYYTCVRGDRISPRVRYNLGDVGKTMPVSDLLATLKKHGINLKNPPNTNLPLLFIWGRQGAQVSFRACKLAPENLGEGIRRLDAEDLHGLNAEIGHYGFYQYEDHGKTMTEIHLEFNEEKGFDEANVNLLQSLIGKLASVNTDFAAQVAACPQGEMPRLRVFKKGESPMAIQQQKYPMRKKQYIFKTGDEFIPDHANLASKGKLITLA